MKFFECLIRSNQSLKKFKETLNDEKKQISVYISHSFDEISKEMLQWKAITSQYESKLQRMQDMLSIYKDKESPKKEQSLQDFLQKSQSLNDDLNSKMESMRLEYQAELKQ